jgi:hypothetical protein
MNVRSHPYVHGLTSATQNAHPKEIGTVANVCRAAIERRTLPTGGAPEHRPFRVTEQGVTTPSNGGVCDRTKSAMFAETAENPRSTTLRGAFRGRKTL